MGFLAKVFNELTSKAEQQPSDEALLDALCLAASSDEEVSDEEYEHVVDLAMDLEAFRDRGQKSVEKAIRRAFERVEDEGDIEASLERIAHEVPDKQGRRLVFHLIALVQQLDGDITEDEDDLLGLAARALEISDKRVEKILEEVDEALGQYDGDSDDDDGDDAYDEGDEGDAYDEGDYYDDEPPAAEVPMKRVWPEACKNCGAQIAMPSAEAEAVTCTYCNTKYPVELQPITPT